MRNISQFKANTLKPSQPRQVTKRTSHPSPSLTTKGYLQTYSKRQLLVQEWQYENFIQTTEGSQSLRVSRVLQILNQLHSLYLKKARLFFQALKQTYLSRAVVSSESEACSSRNFQQESSTHYLQELQRLGRLSRVQSGYDALCYVFKCQVQKLEVAAFTRIKLLLKDDNYRLHLKQRKKQQAAKKAQVAKFVTILNKLLLGKLNKLQQQCKSIFMKELTDSLTKYKKAHPYSSSSDSEPQQEIVEQIQHRTINRKNNSRTQVTANQTDSINKNFYHTNNRTTQNYNFNSKVNNNHKMSANQIVRDSSSKQNLAKLGTHFTYEEKFATTARKTGSQASKEYQPVPPFSAGVREAHHQYNNTKQKTALASQAFSRPAATQHIYIINNYQQKSANPSPKRFSRKNSREQASHSSSKPVYVRVPLVSEDVQIHQINVPYQTKNWQPSEPLSNGAKRSHKADYKSTSIKKLQLSSRHTGNFQGESPGSRKYFATGSKNKIESQSRLQRHHQEREDVKYSECCGFTGSCEYCHKWEWLEKTLKIAKFRRIGNNI